MAVSDGRFLIPNQRILPDKPTLNKGVVRPTNVY
jgi:hypothetical protein